MGLEPCPLVQLRRPACRAELNQHRECQPRLVLAHAAPERLDGLLVGHLHLADQAGMLDRGGVLFGGAAGVAGWSP